MFKKVFCILLMLLTLFGCSTVKEVTDYKTSVSLSFLNSSSEETQTEFEGLYSGEIKNKLPDGKGSFVADDGWSVSGVFSKGKLSGNSVSVDMPVSMILDRKSRVYGTYSGELSDGKPHGAGCFQFTSNNHPAEYEGEFKNGLTDGYGKMTYHLDNFDYVEEGTYEKGVFKPTVGQLYRSFSYLDILGTYNVSDEIVDFIDNHKDQYQTDEALKENSHDYFNYDGYLNNDMRKKVIIYNLNLTSAQIIEENIMGVVLTTILAYDKAYHFYTLHFIGDHIGLEKGTEFSFHGIPCSESSFENVSGGITNSVSFLCLQISY